MADVKERVSKTKVNELKKRLLVTLNEYRYGNTGENIVEQILDMWDSLTDMIKSLYGYTDNQILELYRKYTCEMFSSLSENLLRESSRIETKSYFPSCTYESVIIKDENNNLKVMSFIKCIDYGDESKKVAIKLLKKAFVQTISDRNNIIKEFGTEKCAIGSLAFQWKAVTKDQELHHFFEAVPLADTGHEVVSKKTVAKKNWDMLSVVFRNGWITDDKPMERKLGSRFMSEVGYEYFLSLHRMRDRYYYPSAKFLVDSVVNLTSVKGVTGGLSVAGPQSRVRPFIYAPSISKLMEDLLSNYPYLVAYMMYVSKYHFLIISAPDMLEFVNSRVMDEEEISKNLKGIFTCHCGKEEQDIDFSKIWEIINSTHKSFKDEWMDVIRAWMLSRQFYSLRSGIYSNVRDALFVEK